MRAYFTTTAARTRAILRHGFVDLYEQWGRRGVYFATRPLRINEGFKGNVTLCLEIPDRLLEEHDVTDTLIEQCGYRLALVPAAALNRLGKPQVYDHAYASCSRRDLVRICKAIEETGSDSAQKHARQMRDAIAFFDEIGWLTPIQLQEEAGRG
jgi:hypothetical protein